MLFLERSLLLLFYPSLRGLYLFLESVHLQLHFFLKKCLWKKLLYPECLFAVDLFLQMFIGWYTFLLISGLSKGLNLVSFASILGSVAQYMESLLCKFQCDRPYFDGSNSTVHEVSL